MPTDPANPEPTAPLPAYILAGGRSVRFGSDKARAVVEGKPLIRHVMDALSQVASGVTVVAQEQDAYADLGLDTIPDSAADRGPVQGLLAALAHCAETRGEGWLLLTACDMLPDGPNSFDALFDTLGRVPADRNAIACRTDRWHPMPGLYHTRLLPAVAGYLADGGRAFQGLFDRPNTLATAIVGRDEPLPMRFHANTPDALRGGWPQSPVKDKR